MFTGLIEDIGTIVDIRKGTDQASLTVATNIPTEELTLGESIAVNGACLTVTRFGGGRFTADVSPESLDKTTLGALNRNDRVNLERALRLSDRLGGHLVSGHVDGCGLVTERYLDGNAWRFRFQLEASLVKMLVGKGSVTIEGISLTVNEVADESFTVAIIPHTLEQTTLQDAKVGDRVNIETDLIGKYVARFLGQGDGRGNSGVTAELLAKHGFL